jgi:pimeloyl-ACP methyl ester carboxylesterase
MTPWSGSNFSAKINALRGLVLSVTAKERSCATLAARRAPADAFVSVAGVGREMHVVLREQLAKNLPKDLKEKSDKIIDELKELAKLEIPVLIVQGTTDVQTMVEDAKALAAAKKDAKLVIIDGMNHTLRKAATQAEQARAYFDPSLPLAPNLVEEIATFLREALVKSR